MRLQPRAAALALLLATAGCVSERQASVSPVPAAPPPAGLAARTALEAGVRAGPPVATLPIDPVRARDALAAFNLSCAALLKRPDVSGLTRAPDWQPACAAAAAWPRDDAPGFFRRYFETALVGEGHLFATGYYEPQIDAAPTPSLQYNVPIYGLPNDMVTADLGQWAPDLKGRSIKGRVQNGKLVPYYDRGQIEDGAIKGSAPVIGYAADPIAFFFLQVQGSGRLRQPDGQVIQLNYAGQNGMPYTGIGKWLVGQGLITVDQGSMQGITAWLKAHPDQADGVMRQNRAFVFFKVIPGATEPLGAMGVPVAGHVSVAADPAFTPLGAPVWLSADRAEAGGLWVAQDTGGAIKGPNRFDTYWGGGDEAARIAGGMSARGLSYLLLPTGTLARLGVDGTRAARS
ncbi:MAG TPA: murein transglycosylase A [Sphingomonas sp.]